VTGRLEGHSEDLRELWLVPLEPRCDEPQNKTASTCALQQVMAPLVGGGTADKADNSLCLLWVSAMRMKERDEHWRRDG